MKILKREKATFEEKPQIDLTKIYTTDQNLLPKKKIVIWKDALGVVHAFEE